MVLDPRVEVKTHNKYGFYAKGLFVNAPVKKGEKMWWYDADSGETYPTWSKAQIVAQDQETKEKLCVYSFMLDDDVYCTTMTPEEDSSWYFNHTCDPTVWHSDDYTLVAARDLQPGDEIAYDYGFTETEESMHAGMQCMCGSKECQGLLLFNKYRDSEWQRKYEGRTTSYITKKIQEVRNGGVTKNVDNPALNEASAVAVGAE